MPREVSRTRSDGRVELDVEVVEDGAPEPLEVGGRALAAGRRSRGGHAGDERLQPAALDLFRRRAATRSRRRTRTRRAIASDCMSAPKGTLAAVRLRPSGRGESTVTTRHSRMRLLLALPGCPARRGWRCQAREIRERGERAARRQSATFISASAATTTLPAGATLVRAARRHRRVGTLDGTVEDDVTTIGGDISVGPHAVVNGDLNSRRRPRS